MPPGFTRWPDARRSTAGPIVSDRAAEIVEAVLLLNSLGKPAELICSQLDLTAAEVAVIVKTGQIPVRQKTLFVNPIESQKEKPESRLAPWVQALRK